MDMFLPLYALWNHLLALKSFSAFLFFAKKKRYLKRIGVFADQNLAARKLVRLWWDQGDVLAFRPHAVIATPFPGEGREIFRISKHHKSNLIVRQFLFQNFTAL